jgi:hypothetical protein
MNIKLAKSREEEKNWRQTIKNCINHMREWKNKLNMLYMDKIMCHSSDVREMWTNTDKNMCELPPSPS